MDLKAYFAFSPKFVLTFPGNLNAPKFLDVPKPKRFKIKSKRLKKRKHLKTFQNVYKRIKTF